MAQDPIVTGAGTPGEITWDIERTSISTLPSQVPKSWAAIPNLPASTGRVPGQYSAKWQRTADNGIAISDVRFVDDSSAEHRMAELLEWHNLRLLAIDDTTGKITESVQVPLDTPREVLLLNAAGLRTKRPKWFAWGVSASFYIPKLVISKITYALDVTLGFAFSPPRYDQDPGGLVLALKAYPTLTFKLSPHISVGTLNGTTSVAADLKLDFAPRLTSDSQHRPDEPNKSYYLPESRHDTNVVGVYCDTNGVGRTQPGPPFFPDWDRVFDYVDVDIQTERVFDAVIFPSTKTNDTVFTLNWPLGKGTLQCKREMRQGEYDNLHIHPYVGFDDPAADKGRADQTHAMIEAPIGNDEVVHMHWRWGTKLALPGKAKVQPDFAGFNANDEPNQWAGNPLLPWRQSLKIRLTHPDTKIAWTDADTWTSTGKALDPKRTSVWYCAVAHTPDYNSLVQFFGHGFGLGYQFKGAGTWPFSITAEDLLGWPKWALCYHSLRWNGDGVQRVPSESDKPGLSRNNIDNTDPAHNKAKL